MDEVSEARALEAERWKGRGGRNLRPISGGHAGDTEKAGMEESEARALEAERWKGGGRRGQAGDTEKRPGGMEESEARAVEAERWKGGQVLTSLKYSTEKVERWKGGQVLTSLKYSTEKVEGSLKYSTEKGLLVLSEGAQRTLNVLLLPDDACFGGGSREATLLLEAFIGYDTVLISQLHVHFRRGFVHNTRYGDLYNLHIDSSGGEAL
ncbi:hypothetical protein T484DRAFT_1814281 [Baffinella frigidus]|nr:hypothetical protein T484DRAFT_1814281 [Cryptophyta sp. CCMP2293]